VVTNNLNGTYSTTRKVDQHAPSLYTTQVRIGVAPHYLADNIVHNSGMNV
jgi:hypothetical protein